MLDPAPYAPPVAPAEAIAPKPEPSAEATPATPTATDALEHAASDTAAPATATIPAEPAAETSTPQMQARSGKALYDLGKLPAELELPMPAAPHTTREAIVHDAAELERETRRGQVRIVVAGEIAGTARVLGSDIEITMREGARVEKLVIDHEMKAARKRIALLGGQYGEIAMIPPARFSPTPQVHHEWAAEDIIIDGVKVQSAQGSAIQVYGRRIAVVRSQASAKAYAVYSGPVQTTSVTEGLLIAGNRLSSTGIEATIRLVSVTRSVVIDNVLRNPIKHNYRVHGASDLAFFARNVLIDTGAAAGFMPQDQVGRVWMLDNTVYHKSNHLMFAEPGRVRSAHVRGNVAYTARPCVLCVPNLPAGWEDSSNKALPYREAPGL